MREFETGATRDDCDDKPDYEGFLSPLVIVRYGEYMHKHRKQADGAMRASDNWQKGMPLDAYMKSAWRHFIDWWREHRGLPSREGLEDALCALIFNASGYLHEVLKEREVEQSNQREAVIASVFTATPAPHGCHDCKWSHKPKHVHPCFKCQETGGPLDRWEGHV